MCNTPVTLGGGITTVNGGLSSGLLLKYLLSSQCKYHLSSSSFGSKFLEREVLMLKTKLECKFNPKAATEHNHLRLPGWYNKKLPVHSLRPGESYVIERSLFL
jgi:hypothetical protein